MPVLLCSGRSHFRQNQMAVEGLTSAWLARRISWRAHVTCVCVAASLVARAAATLRMNRRRPTVWCLSTMKSDCPRDN